MSVHPQRNPQQLAVGDHVRVVLRHQSASCDEAPHTPDEPGHTGRVLGVPRLTFAPTHPYLVLFDRPCVILTHLGTRLTIPARHYASDELERIDAQTDACANGHAEVQHR